MALQGLLNLGWRFGRMFLDYMNPQAPSGTLVYVSDTRVGDNVSHAEVSYSGGPEFMAGLMAEPVDPNLSLGENVLAYCDRTMARLGNLPGVVAPSPAPAPAPAPAPEPSPAPAPEPSPAPAPAPEPEPEPAPSPAPSEDAPADPPVDGEPAPQ